MFRSPPICVRVAAVAGHSASSATAVKKMGLGSAKAARLKLSEAKDKAIDALRLLARGTDPRDHRDDEKRTQGSRLFGEFAEEWRQTCETGLKHKAARNKLKRIVQVICKPLHKLRLDEIETEHVVAVLRKVWHQREISCDTRHGSRRSWTLRSR